MKMNNTCEECRAEMDILSNIKRMEDLGERALLSMIRIWYCPDCLKYYYNIQDQIVLERIENEPEII